VSNLPVVMLLESLAPNFANLHMAWLVLAMDSTLAGKSDDRGKRGEYHHGRFLL
jgi:hypothetical protein